MTFMTNICSEWWGDLTWPKKTLRCCDIWDTDYNTDNWEPEFMTFFVTWQLIVTLDSIRNSCYVFKTNDIRNMRDPIYDVYLCLYVNPILQIRMVCKSNIANVIVLTAVFCNIGLTQGWAGIPVSRDSRVYKPQISLPFPSLTIGILNFSSRFQEKEVWAMN